VASLTFSRSPSHYLKNTLQPFSFSRPSVKSSFPRHPTKENSPLQHFWHVVTVDCYCLQLCYGLFLRLYYFIPILASYIIFADFVPLQLSKSWPLCNKFWPPTLEKNARNIQNFHMIFPSVPKSTILVYPVQFPPLQTRLNGIQNWEIYFNLYCVGKH